MPFDRQKSRLAQMSSLISALTEVLQAFDMEKSKVAIRASVIFWRWSSRVLEKEIAWDGSKPAGWFQFYSTISAKANRRVDDQGRRFCRASGEKSFTALKPEELTLAASEKMSCRFFKSLTSSREEGLLSVKIDGINRSHPNTFTESSSVTKIKSDTCLEMSHF